jgi:hypothetical protein
MTLTDLMEPTRNPVDDARQVLVQLSAADVKALGGEFAEGMAAVLDWQPASACPYADGSPAWAAWQMGFEIERKRQS